MFDTLLRHNQQGQIAAMLCTLTAAALAAFALCNGFQPHSVHLHTTTSIRPLTHVRINPERTSSERLSPIFSEDSRSLSEEHPHLEIAMAPAAFLSIHEQAQDSGFRIISASIIAASAAFLAHVVRGQAATTWNRLRGVQQEQHALIEVCIDNDVAMFPVASKKAGRRRSDRKNERNRLYNSEWTSRVRTATKRFLAVMGKFDKQPTLENRNEMAKALAEVYTVCDKASVKGVLPRNTASRRKARVGRLYSARYHKVGATTVAMAMLSGDELRDTEVAMFPVASKKMGRRRSDRKNERNRIYNMEWRSRVRTATKRFLAVMATFDKDPSLQNRASMATALAEVYAVCDKSSVKGVLMRNTAARRKARVGRLYSARFHSVKA